MNYRIFNPSATEIFKLQEGEMFPKTPKGKLVMLDEITAHNVRTTGLVSFHKIGKGWYKAKLPLGWTATINNEGYWCGWTWIIRNEKGEFMSGSHETQVISNDPKERNIVETLKQAKIDICLEMTYWPQTEELFSHCDWR